MPRYLYKCPECETEMLLATIGFVPGDKNCKNCGAEMRRIPQAFYVNWNGNKPSDGGVTQAVKHLVDDAPRRRDELQQYKEVKNDD